MSVKPLEYNTTFSIYKIISEDQMRCLTNDFEKFIEETNELEFKRHNYIRGNFRFLYRKWHGLTWIIGPTTNMKMAVGDRCCIVEANINPKVYLGQEGSSVDDVDCLKIIESRFYNDAKRISNILGDFSEYNLKQVKYHINLDIKNLKAHCTAEQMVTLLKSGNTPFSYSKCKKYLGSTLDHLNHIDMLYAKCDSVHANFPGGNYRVNDLIRFDVQCKYKINYPIKGLLNGKTESTTELLHELFSSDFCRDILSNCYNWVVMQGDYYSMDKAKEMILSKGFSKDEETRLKNTLDLVCNFEGIEKGISIAMEHVHEDELAEIYKALKKLVELGINPVTIPSKWNISFIQNILDAHINGPCVRYFPLKNSEQENP